MRGAMNQGARSERTEGKVDVDCFEQSRFGDGNIEAVSKRKVRAWEERDVKEGIKEAAIRP